MVMSRQCGSYMPVDKPLKMIELELQLFYGTYIYEEVFIWKFQCF